MIETIERRILGAVRFVDISTKARISRPLKVTAEKLTFVRNLSGDYAITRAEDADLSKHLDAFEKPPAAPAVEAREFFGEVKDPAGEFLPRAFSIKLPRDPNANNAGAATSLFRAVEVAMLSSPNRYIDANWCVVRVSVKEKATQAPIPRAGIRVTTTNPPQTVFGITEASGDSAGEALAVLAGVPFHTVSTDPNNNTELVLTEIDAVLEAFAHKQGDAVWPELIAANDNNLIQSEPVALKVAPGRTIAKTIEIVFP